MIAENCQYFVKRIKLVVKSIFTISEKVLEMIGDGPLSFFICLIYKNTIKLIRMKKIV